MQLSAQQERAISNLPLIWKTHPYASLGGYAGTGKTTLIKTLCEQHKGTRVAAYTGKAAEVLRKKGVSATTIHSLIYQLVIDEETGKPILDSEGQLQWDKRDLSMCSLLIIDEASMVPRWIHNDLLSYNIPLVYIGDHGQLPPVSDDDFNIMLDPHIRLTEIHRNAGEIAHFAEFLREDNHAYDWKNKTEGAVKVESNIDPLLADQCICGFNKTRKAGNTWIREHRGMGPLPQKDDRMIILANDKDLRVFNGQQGIVKERKKHRLTLDLGDREVTFPISVRNLDKPSGNALAVDYSYFITCHKAQGDEYDKLAVYEEQCSYWEPHRWNYTAASRAKSFLWWNPQ